MIRNINSQSRIKQEDKLVAQFQDMIKETAAGRLKWEIICSTTEYNEVDTKPVETIDGISYQVDECYVSYYTTYKGNEFLIITYEMIHTSKNDIKTNNLVFMPPLGIRYFDITRLLPFSIEADQMLTYHVHQLWQVALERYKINPNQIRLSVESRELIIEE